MSDVFQKLNHGLILEIHLEKEQEIYQLKLLYTKMLELI